MADATTSSRARLALIALTLVTLALRLWGIGYGVPVWEEPDPDIPGHFELARYGATVAGVEHPEQQYPHLLYDIARWLPGRDEVAADAPVGAHLAAAAHTHFAVRGLVALIATALVPLTFALARRFASSSWALFAAALVASSLLHQSFAQQARPHGAAATLFALAVIADLRLVRAPSWRNYVSAGVALALALGALHSAVALAIPGLVAHALRAGERKFFDLKLAACVALGLAAIPVFYPFLFGVGLIQGADELDVAEGGVRFAEHAISLSQFQGRGFGVLARVAWSYEPTLVVLLALAFVGWLVGRERGLDRERRAERWVVLAFVVPYAIAIGLFEFTYERFALPLLPFAAVFVAVGFEAACRRAIALRVAAAALAVVSLALPFAACAKLAWLRSRPDTLALAARWIEANAPRETVFVSASQPLDLPLARAATGFKPFGARQLTPWTRWQLALDESARPEPRFDVRWLGPPARGASLEAHVRSLAPALVLAEPYASRAGHPMLSELSRALAASGERVARFSPDADPSASDLELFWQLSDHFNEPGEHSDWPNFTRRVLGARAIGPVVELWRIAP